MSFQNLKTNIAAIINANGIGAITGNILQQQLFGVINAIGLNQFKGIATPSSAPPADFEEGFFIASENGLYSSYGNASVSNGVYILWKTSGAWGAPVNLASALLSQIGIGEGVTVPWMSRLANVAPTSLIQDKLMNILAFGGGGAASGVDAGDITTEVGSIMTGAIPVGENKPYVFWGYGNSNIVGAYSGSTLTSGNWIELVSTSQVNANPEAQTFITPIGCTHVNIQVQIQGSENVTGFFFTEGSEFTTEVGKVIIDGAIDGAWIIQTKDLLGKIQQDQLSQAVQDRLDDFESRIHALENP